MAFFFLFSKSAAAGRRRFPSRPHSTLVDLAAIKCVRDQALDHVVEREKNLKPVINLKNLIISDSSKSVPLTTIADQRRSLDILTRPIDFIRSYPSLFEEFLPDAAGVVPHVRLTPDAVELDLEEKLMYERDSYKQQVADRLVKLLMLNRVHKIPLSLVDRIKWDLGLPIDYLETMIPMFPDYFHVVGSGDERFLELVCWIDELAVSVAEKKAMKAERDGLYLGEYMKGMPIEFQVKYSADFEMDKKYKKWLDNWQKLPYLSPYQNASHLSSASDESDKWAVGVLHELLHILVPKKSEKDNLLCFGEYMGLRPRLKRAMLQHPGIFYMSSKLGTHTIVLREAYKRTVLIDKNVMMNMRSQYIHLMNMPKHVAKQQSNKQKKHTLALDGDGEGKLVQNDEDSDSLYSSSSEVEDDSDEIEDADEDDDLDEEIQEKKQRGTNFIKLNIDNGKKSKKHQQVKTSHCKENSSTFRYDRANKTNGRSSEGCNAFQSRDRRMFRGTDDRSDAKRTTSTRSRITALQEESEWVGNGNASVKPSEFDRRRSSRNTIVRQTDDKRINTVRSNSPRSRGSPAYGGTGRQTNNRSNPTRVRPSFDSRSST